MKKRLAIVLMCLTLVSALTACNLADMEVGGLIGELLENMEGTEHLEYEPGIGDDYINNGTDINPGWEVETWGDVSIDYVDPEPYDPLPPCQFDGAYAVVLSNQDMALGDNVEVHEFIQEATANRNALVEEKYNIALIFKTESDPIKLNDYVRNDVISGSGEYSIVYQQMGRAGSELVQGDRLLNLRELPYVDFDQPWWDASVNDTLSIGNYLFMATGATTPDVTLQTSVIAFNARMMDESGLEYPYELVREGRWTLDEMLRMSKVMYSDLNGDGRRDDGDRLGFAGVTFDTDNAFMVATESGLILKDTNRMPDLAQSDRLVATYEMLYELCLNYGLYVSISDYLASGVDAAMIPTKAFIDDRALFLGTTLGDLLEGELGGEMQVGLVPYPKLDKAQEEYHSPVNYLACAVVVPKSCQDPELAGCVLEASAIFSDDEYSAAYQKLAMKNLSDPEAIDMFSLIMQTKDCDFTAAYFAVNAKDSGASMIFQELLKNGSTGAASAVRSKEKVLTKALKQLLEIAPSQ